MRVVAERHELDAIEHGGGVRGAAREPDRPRRLRQDVRDVRENRVEQTVGAVAPQARFDGSGGARRPFRFEELVHVKAIAAIGRDASGRGVGLLHVPLFLEAREDVAHGRGRDAKPCGGDQQG